MLIFSRRWTVSLVSSPASCWHLANKERIWLFILQCFEHLYFTTLIDLLINFSILNSLQRNVDFWYRGKLSEQRVDRELCLELWEPQSNPSSSVCWALRHDERHSRNAWSMSRVGSCFLMRVFLKNNILQYSTTILLAFSIRSSNIGSCWKLTQSQVNPRVFRVQICNRTCGFSEIVMTKNYFRFYGRQCNALTR